MEAPGILTYTTLQGDVDVERMLYCLNELQNLVNPVMKFTDDKVFFIIHIAFHYCDLGCSLLLSIMFVGIGIDILPYVCFFNYVLFSSALALLSVFDIV